MSVPQMKLSNAVTMPQLGFGVWRIKDDAEARASIGTALETGYRSIDTAMIYGNESSVGAALAASGIPRDELFVTTKLWNTDQGYDSTLAALDGSLERLGLDHVDLYLIHWAVPGKYLETWRAFERIYDNKLARAIGVSNFQISHLDDVAAHANIQPMVNQIELHPMLQQREVREYCAKHGIQVESWSPLMNGRDILKHPVIGEIAQAHTKTTAQIILRWHIQHGLVAIPKSVNVERIQSNFDIFGFELSATEMAKIDALDANWRTGRHPDQVDA